MNGKLIPGATDTSYIAKRSGRFRVSVTNGPGGCANTSAEFRVKDCSIWLNNNEPDTTCYSYFYASRGLVDTSFKQNESFTKTIYPPKPGDLLKVNFSSFVMHSFDDYLTIYDGPDVNSPVLWVMRSPYPPLGSNMYSTQGPLTFKINSGSGPTHVGSWDAFIECYTPKVYRTSSGGNLEDKSIWEVKTGPNSYTEATLPPRYIDDSIIIRPGHTVTKTNVTYTPLDQVWLQKGAKLVVNQQFGLNNGKGYDMIADGDIEMGKFGSLGGGDGILLRGNMTGEFSSVASPLFIAGTSPQTLYFTRCYFGPLHILNKTTTTITGLIQTDSLYMNTPGRLTINSAEISHMLSLKNGIIDITGSGLIKSPSSYRLTVEGGSDSSFVNGPLSLPIYTRGIFNLRFPIGRNNVYKPVTLTVNKQSFPYEDQYKVQVINQAPIYRPFADNSISNVSSLRHYNIVSQKRYPVTSLHITLQYDENDVVGDPADLRIARDSGYKWINIGGLATNPAPDTIKSTIGISVINNGTNAFGDFVLANVTGGVLPVTWLGFTAALQGEKALLTWSVTNEMNGAYYEVEYSLDGEHFSTLARVPSGNNGSMVKTYSWLHAVLLADVNYYRIKQVDKDGKIEYSKVVSLKQANESILQIVPNPSKGNVQIKTNTAAGEMLLVRVTDAAGKTVYSRTYRGGRLINVNLSNLASGTYVVSVNGKSGKIVISK